MRLRSYRTYEEWKQAVQNAITLTKMCSYRTYEEWKPSMFSTCPLRLTVLTVPMRNGNMRYNVAFVNQVIVLTVPMRNGNIPLLTGRKWNK